MPISIADLKNETAETTVETSFGPLLVRYRPNEMTPTREAELRAADDPDDPAIIGLFCDLVAWMDLAGPLADADGNELVAAGELVPMEPACVACLPSLLLSRVLTAIQEEMSEPDPKPRGRPSRNGSFSRRR